MKRLWKWLLLVLIFVEVALVRLGLLELRTAIGVVLGVEALLLIVGVRQMVVAVRRYRGDRRVGLDPWAALENGMEVLLPRKVARVVATEPKLWFYLWMWLLRRVKRGDNDFSYHGWSLLGPFLVVLLFTTPVEVLLIELLLPWAWLRWLLLILAVYGFFWICGLYASLVALPHRLGDTSLHVSYGILAQAQIAYGDITEVEIVRRSVRGDGLRIASHEDAAYLAVGGNTNVTLRLRAPKSLWGWLGSTAPVTQVHLASDEPERLVKELRTRVEAVG